jgi:hypothetical protein
VEIIAELMFELLLDSSTLVEQNIQFFVILRVLINSLRKFFLQQIIEFPPFVDDFVLCLSLRRIGLPLLVIVHESHPDPFETLL